MNLHNIIPILRAQWKEFIARLHGSYCRSYAQCGEDLLLKSFLYPRLTPTYRGFWVDIGAHDPIRYSNTKIFSDLGWRGINVDALPRAIAKFNKLRKRDINVNVGIGSEHGRLDYFMFNDPAVNTLSPEFAHKVASESSFKLIGKQTIDVIPLCELLEKHLPKQQKIDFFTIDTEGLDLAILQSNDWSRFRPDFILIEIHTPGRRNDEIPTCKVSNYLKQLGYVFVGQGLCTTLFANVDCLSST